MNNGSRTTIRETVKPVETVAGKICYYQKNWIHDLKCFSGSFTELPDGNDRDHPSESTFHNAIKPCEDFQYIYIIASIFIYGSNNILIKM